MILLKNGYQTNDPRLDRIPQFDPKSRQFPIRPLLEERGATVPRGYSWAFSHPLLDQGAEGACVGFGWTDELIARPIPILTPDNIFAHNLYKLAQQNDEWPGEDYEGSSVLGGAKAVQQEGYLGEYRWAFGLDDLVLALGHHGPAVLGLNWMTGMMDTDADGFIHATGSVEGGHCVCATRVSVRQKWVSGPNSWGGDWGVGGFWRISFDDLAKLLQDEGEACIPSQRLRPH